MSGVLAGLLDPYRLLFLLSGAGLALLWRRRSVPVRSLLLATVPYAALGVLSMPAVAYLSLGMLEWRYPPSVHRPDDAEAIVVLGGGMQPADATRPRAEMNMASLLRCLHAAEVYRGGKACPVVVCGGKIAPGPSTPALALLMREFLREQGIRDEDIILEDRSRTTHENAVECRKVLDRWRIGKVILVTEAVHMLRAVQSFRKQGITVVPSACHHRATEFDWSVWGFLPSVGAVQAHELALHEYLGFAWYWVRGRL